MRGGRHAVKALAEQTARATGEINQVFKAVDAMSNVVQLFEQKTVPDDLLSRLESFRTKIQASDLTDELEFAATLTEMCEFAAEAADQITRFRRRFDAVDRLIDAVENADCRLQIMRQIEMNKESLVAATLELACEFRRLNSRLL